MTDVHHYLQYLGYLNSFINPFIYTGFNQEFRNLFHSMFTSVKISCIMCLSRFRLNKYPSGRRESHLL